MLQDILLAAWLTILFVLFNETRRAGRFYKRLKRTDRLLEIKLMNALREIDAISVFKVREIRMMLEEEFVKTGLMDSFELYRVDAHRLMMTLKKEGAEQAFEIQVQHNRFLMREIYSGMATE